MTKTKSTKRALLMSALALVMCVSMLIGSTFAWFTDSVSSTNNIIKSGNLDVELEYLNGNSWEKVTATTNVFEENTLWEPGHTEVVYLRVSNLGTLALKYQLGINIVNEVESINVAGKTLRLSDYIEFGAIENVETPYADRVAARAAVTEAKKLSTGYTQAGNIEAGAAAQYVALVVYMPEKIGNEANYRTGEVAPEIHLGINLMATQYTSEKDSFDETYDANAKFDGIPAARTTTLAKMPVVTTINDNTYTLDTAYVFETTETYEQAQLNARRYWHADFVATFDKDVDGSNMGLAGQYDYYSEEWLAFELDGMTIEAGTPVRMLETANISMNYEELCNFVKKFSCGAFAVNQAQMAGTTMTVELRLYETTIDPNATSGNANDETGEYITIGTYSYTFGAKKVSTVDELKAAIENGAKAIELTAGTFEFDWADRDLLNGVTIIGNSPETSTLLFTGYGPGTWYLNGLTLENVTVVDRCKPENNAYSYWHSYFDVSGLTATNVVFETGVKTANAESTFTNCTFVSGYYWNYSTQAYSTEEMYGLVANGDVTVEGCSFTGFRGIDVSAACNVTVEDSTFNVTNTEKDAINVKVDGATVTVNGVVIE